jgi:hypothetical protein
LNPASRRAENLAATISSGSEILAFLRKPEISDRLVEAAERGKPSVGAVADQLRAQFPDLLEQVPLRRAVGQLIAGVMAERGYAVSRPAVRVTDKQFSKAAVFSRTSSDPHSAESQAPMRGSSNLAERLVSGLNRVEGEALLRALTKKFPDLR